MHQGAWKVRIGRSPCLEGFGGVLWLYTYPVMARSSLASTVLLGCLALMVLEACAERPPSGHAASDRQPGHQATVVAAGDIASCGSPDDEATARLLGSIPGTVLTLGDNAYKDGSVAEYAECYDPTWGRFEGRTRPAPGNHEYYTPGAAGYFGYFGKAAGSPGKGYYSYDLGEWHVISLNSMCENVGGCGATSPMLIWLKSSAMFCSVMLRSAAILRS